MRGEEKGRREREKRRREVKGRREREKRRGEVKVKGRRGEGAGEGGRGGIYSIIPSEINWNAHQKSSKIPPNFLFCRPFRRYACRRTRVSHAWSVGIWRGNRAHGHVSDMRADNPSVMPSVLASEKPSEKPSESRRWMWQNPVIFLQLSMKYRRVIVRRYIRRWKGKFFLCFVCNPLKKSWIAN